MTYLAGQLTCRECGHVALLTKHLARAFVRMRCPMCDSRRTSIPIWWKLDDQAEIDRSAARDFLRAKTKALHRGRMN